jgi:FMN phosphatase YigB (HAD superfamily)
MDDSKIHIEGARQLGMKTVLWTNREEGFRRFLGKLRSDGMEIESPNPRRTRETK